MTYGYIRVSTDRQTVENQRFEIEEFSRRQEIKIDSWIEETISGTVDPGKRELGALLSRVQKGDLIICSELSRLGRSLFMIMSILNLIMEKARASGPSRTTTALEMTFRAKSWHLHSASAQKSNGTS